MAGLLDQAGLVARSVHDYKRAYALHLRALKIRQNFLDDKHPDISHSLMNLASLCRDRALEEGERWQKEAEALEHQVDNLRQHVEFISSDLSNQRSRPFVPDLAVNKGTSMLPGMVVFAQSIIDKHKQTPHVSPSNPGLASVVGNWSIPTDVVITSRVSSGVSHDTTSEGEEVSSGSSEQQSDLANVDIFLCDTGSYSTLSRAIQSYGAQRGLTMKDFGVEWPANHKQAKDLLVKLKATAESIRTMATRTDKNGDFEMTSIPKGTFFLFAVLVTKAHCTMWFQPQLSNPITVTRVQQFRVEFTRENGTVIWPTNGTASALFGAVRIPPPPLTQHYLVPPPPPMRSKTYP